MAAPEARQIPIYDSAQLERVLDAMAAQLWPRLQEAGPVTLVGVHRWPTPCNGVCRHGNRPLHPSGGWIC
jgi:hypothetical protein